MVDVMGSQCQQGMKNVHHAWVDSMRLEITLVMIWPRVEGVILVVKPVQPMVTVHHVNQIQLIIAPLKDANTLPTTRV